MLEGCIIAVWNGALESELFDDDIVVGGALVDVVGIPDVVATLLMLSQFSCLLLLPSSPGENIVLGLLPTISWVGPLDISQTGATLKLEILSEDKGYCL